MFKSIINFYDFVVHRKGKKGLYILPLILCKPTTANIRQSHVFVKFEMCVVKTLFMLGLKFLENFYALL